MLNSINTIDQPQDREELDQVRTLLFGEIQRENQKRFSELEAQIRELRQTMERRLATLSADNTARQQEFIRTLGSAITDLGAQIGQLAAASAPETTDHE